RPKSSIGYWFDSMDASAGLLPRPGEAHIAQEGRPDGVAGIKGRQATVPLIDHPEDLAGALAIGEVVHSLQQVAANASAAHVRRHEEILKEQDGRRSPSECRQA